MDKCKNNGSLAEELTGFLIKLHEGKENSRLRKQATRLISIIKPNDIAHAEQRLAREGLPLQKIQQLSAAFVLMGVLEGDSETLRSRLGPNHILRKVMAEHEMTRCFLSDLEEIALHIQQENRLSGASREFMRLTHVVEHLNALEEHIDREDDVLFPVLKEYGWKSLFEHIESEHVHITLAINDLVKLVMAFEKMPFEMFKTRLLSTVRYLCPLMREHLFREDHALFPLAVSMVEDSKVWDRLRTVCNEIDYCGIHL
ncbi:MAG: DUF438 domain-containing protein [Planctomycetota bacterium]|jgi:DUF438 domain-containing protein